MTYSRRSRATVPCSLQLQADRDERLLTRLRELTDSCDPVPEHATAAARSALSTRITELRQRSDVPR
jgi:hypothetical protein